MSISSLQPSVETEMRGVLRYCLSYRCGHSNVLLAGGKVNKLTIVESR